LAHAPANSPFGPAFTKANKYVLTRGNPKLDWANSHKLGSVDELKKVTAGEGPDIAKTDPDSRLARKGRGKEALLSYSGNLLVENRNGLIVNAMVWPATGDAERTTALLMLKQVPGDGRITVSGDKGFDTRDFVAECREMNATPHVAQNHNRSGGSAIDGRTTRHAGYRISQRRRMRIEECFGW